MMNCEIGDYKGTTVISLSGEVDMHSSPILRDKLLGIIKNKPPRLIVNFKDVSYIDSSGIATFVEGLKHVKSYKGRLQFLELPQAIMDIFSFSRLDKVFEICRDMDDAVGR